MHCRFGGAPACSAVSCGAVGEENPFVVRIVGAWRLGIEQGIDRNERTNRNLAEAFAFYRGRYDMNQTSPGQLLCDSSIPDSSEVPHHSVLIGFADDDLLYN